MLSVRRLRSRRARAFYAPRGLSVFACLAQGTGVVASTDIPDYNEWESGLRLQHLQVLASYLCAYLNTPNRFFDSWPSLPIHPDSHLSSVGHISDRFYHLVTRVVGAFRRDNECVGDSGH
ncbi:hypothetical protein EVAR_22628_1 [Eumeta japonica]|uniref:Uncharacterized protein n=1 Tax=Eumeta variegata TaxID=151549 RepID=A0A4C1VMV1_EUMVA|nr:hypothetical protein EVAR_22628_1 [Eumeta japonica]